MYQRSTGTLHVAFKRRNQLTVLDRLRQEGCLKARFPRGGAEAVLLNSSGGVAGGDRLHVSVSAGAGATATATSQAAERFYRALPGSVSVVENAVTIAAGAALEWLPQETILFDGCALRRRLLVDVAEDGRFLGVESLLFGRKAMGEAVRLVALSDLFEVRRAGRLLLHDRIRMEGDAAAALGRRAVGGGACAAATILLVAADAEAAVDGLRMAMAPWQAGVSAWDGMLVARVVAQDGACLRAAVVAGLAALRPGRPLPRVWNC